MKKKQLVQLAILNCIIIVVNVAAFSEGLLHWSLSSTNAAERAGAITLVFASAVTFLYGNYRLLTVKKSVRDYNMDEFRTPEEYVEALEGYKSSDATFIVEINATIEQIERMDRKSKALNDFLVKNYREDVDDMYALKRLVEDARDLLYENVKRMMNRMLVFDQEEYVRLEKVALDNDTRKAKWAWFSQCICYVKQIVENNEKILLEFDNLLLEVSNHSADDEGESAGLKRMQDTIVAMKKLRNESRDEEDAMNELAKKYQE